MQLNSTILTRLAILVVSVLLVLSACSRQESGPSTGSDILPTTTVLAAISGNSDLSESKQEGHASTANILFATSGRAVGYVDSKGSKFKFVFNGRSGKAYDEILYPVISSDGARYAYGARNGDKWVMVVDGKETTPYEEVGMAVFSPDNKHCLYDTRAGANWALVVDGHGGGTAPSFYSKAFSDDSSKVYSFDLNPSQSLQKLTIRDLSLKTMEEYPVEGSVTLSNQKGDAFIAVSETSAGKRVNVYRVGAKKQPEFASAVYENIGGFAFSQDGKTIAFIVSRGGKNYLVHGSKEVALPPGDVTEAPVVRPDGKGVGVIVKAPGGFRFFEPGFSLAAKEKQYEEAANLIYSNDGASHAYLARNGNNIFMVINGKEGPAFDKIVEPKFSPDGKFVAYRARKDGQRFVVVADKEGKTIKRHPPYEQVFSVAFTKDGQSVAYGVKDGPKLVWKVEKL